jgi:dihydroorotase
VAKTPDDREALREIIREGWSFTLCIVYAVTNNPNRQCTVLLGIGLGTSTISFQIHVDASARVCCYTSPMILPLVAHIMDFFGALARLGDFTSNFERKFYQRELTAAHANAEVVLRKVEQHIQRDWTMGGENVVPFWAGQKLEWSI